MKMMTLTLAVCLALSPGVGIAAETDGSAQLRGAVRSLVDELVREGVLPKEKAGEVVERAMERARREAAVPESRKSPKKTDEAQATESTGSVRVPYIPEPVKQEIIEQIRPSVRQDVVQDILKQAREERWGMPDAFPAWVNRISFFGDLRLRMQSDNFADGNAENYYLNIQRINQTRSLAGAEAYLNTTEDQKNMRLRARVGMLAKVSESVDALVRISTGSTNNPVSTNYTFSNGFSSAQMVLDQGYLRYQSEQKSVTLWGGRLPNPFLTTDLIWDNDLNFDGIAATIRRGPEGSTVAGGAGFQPFLTLGAFPMQTPDRGRDDKWLYGTQLGFDWGFGRSRLSIGAGYYQFSNIVGQANAVGDNSLDYTAPLFVQKGNTVYAIDDPIEGRPLYGLASDFSEVDLVGSLDIGEFGATHVILTAHYVKNIAFDLQEVRNRIINSPIADSFPALGDIEEDATGYLVKLTVGAPKLQNRGDWQAVWSFRRLGSDAVLDAFTDSDFHLGGTDAKGWILGGSYTVAKNTWVSLRYLTSDAINGPPFGIDTWQLDVNARF